MGYQLSIEGAMRLAHVVIGALDDYGVQIETSISFATHLDYIQSEVDVLRGMALNNGQLFCGKCLQSIGVPAKWCL